MADRAFLERLTKQLMDEGKLLEAGWIGLRLAAIPLDAPPIQLKQMHMAYMAGAQHLWASMMAGLDPGVGETAADMRRMDLIARELEAYESELLRSLPVEGRG